MKRKSLKALVKLMPILFMTLLSISVLLFSKIDVKAADEDEGNDEKVEITVSRPDETWIKDEYEISISVNKLNKNLEIKSVSARNGATGKDSNITENLTYTVNDNGTIYITVKDVDGNSYEKDFSIDYFDLEGPELIGAIDEGILSLNVTDSKSGIHSLIINGYEYDNCPDGMLSIRLQQFDASYENFSIYVTDNVGNYSEEYLIANPYYQTEEEREDTSNDDLTAYLPIDAENAAITSAKGTVELHATEYGYTEGAGDVLDENGEEVLDYDGMEFYVISTESGKTFYMIIDKSKRDNNAYLLTEASENDLLNFTGTESLVLPKNGAVIAGTYEGSGAKDEEVVIKGGAYNQSPDAIGNEGEEVEAPKKRPNNNMTMIVIVVAAMGGAFAFMKLKKKKKAPIDELDFGKDEDDIDLGDDLSDDMDGDNDEDNSNDNESEIEAESNKEEPSDYAE